jgi:hypothetical protein
MVRDEWEGASLRARRPEFTRRRWIGIAGFNIRGHDCLNNCSTFLGEKQRLKRFLKTVGSVAVVNLGCFCTAYALLMAYWPHTGLGQFLGIEPTPPASHWFFLLLWGVIILGAPASVLLDGTGSEHFLLLLVLSSLLNCGIWGVCLGYPIYAFGKRFRRAPA